jgi:hypothetical protein
MEIFRSNKIMIEGNWSHEVQKTIETLKNSYDNHVWCPEHVS